MLLADILDRSMNLPVGLVLQLVTDDKLGGDVHVDVHRILHIMAPLDEHCPASSLAPRCATRRVDRN